MFVSDHLFFSLGPDRAKSYRPDEPIVVPETADLHLLRTGVLR